jgi:hypothetical protein
MKDFTFSDGTTVPAGCLMSLPHRSVHIDAVRIQPSGLFRTYPLNLFPGELSGSRCLRWVQVRKDARERRRKHETWNGDSHKRIFTFWTRAPCMVRLRSIILVHGTDRQFPSPGRFFATNEIKTMFAYALVNYDVKMARDRGLPSEWFFGINSTPDPTAEVMFRKRRT